MPERSPIRKGISALFSTLLVASGLIVLAQPAAAAAPLNCLNSIYYTSSGGTVRQVDLTTRTLVAAEPFALPGNSGTGPNQIGLGAGGATAIYGTSTSIVRHTRASDQSTVIAKPAGVGGGTVGAINPRNGLYYYGAYAGNVLSLYVYNPATATSTADVVVTVTVNNPPGANGDIAFDEAGRLYLVAGEGASPFGVALYRADGTVPSVPITPTPGLTSTEISRGVNTGGTNGIAFASDGYLYISQGAAIRQLNPITGNQVGNDIALPGAAITDLGTCAGPSTVAVGAQFPDGRANPNDQFTVGAGGNDYSGGGGTGTVPFPSNSTTGTDTGTTTEPAITLPGQTYQVVQTPVGTTNPANYVTTYRCVALDGTVISSGNGSPGTVTIPAGTDGNSITCSFINDLPEPSIDLTKTVSPNQFSAAGTELTYSFSINNTGNTVLNNYTVTDTLPGLTGLTCTPALGSTLQPAGTANCSATYTVTAADVLAAAPKVNNATAAGTPPTGQGSTVSDSATASAGFLATPPTATNDSGAATFGQSVTLAGSTNDTPGNGAILPALTVLTAPGATNGGKTLTSPEGVFNVQPNGAIVFTPAAGYSGTTPAAPYQITDSNGLSATATVTATIRPGPLALDNATNTPQNVNVTVNVLANDTPGRDVANEPATWQLTSVVFPTDGQPAGATVSESGKTLTVPGEGIYTVDADGQITFDPERAFTGAATGVSYSVTDSLNNAATAVLTITVTPVTPVAVDDAASTPANTPVTLPGAQNDAAGADNTPLQYGLTVFPVDGQPTGAIVAVGGKSVEVPGQGTYVLDDEGRITFTPADGFEGTTTPVVYQIEDANGTTDTATVTVIVQEGPTAAPDAETTPQNVNVDIDVTVNDQTGLNVDGETRAAWDFSSLIFPTAGQPAGSTVSDEGLTLTVLGEGVYTVNQTTGIVTFDPEPQFRSTTTPVIYQVADALGNSVQSTITIIVRPINPVLTNDSQQTPFNTPVTLAGATNDSAGAVSAPLVPEATVFPVDGQPEGSVRSEDGKTLQVPGQGTWTVNPDGSLTFTPEPGFAGSASPVTYQVQDSNGTTGTAIAAVLVQPGPTATPDTGTGLQGLPVTVNPLGNDVPGNNADGSTGLLDPTTVVFPAAGQPGGAQVSEDGRTLTIPGVGVYTITPATGAITFTPESQFVGSTPPVTYQVTDNLGNPATSTVVVAIIAVQPVAASDAATTPYNTPVTLDVLANDAPGAATAPLDPSSLVLLDGTGKLVTTLVIPGEGTWTVVDGKLVFTPEAGFAGTTTPVTYQVSDANGTPVTATAVVEVRTQAITQPDRVVTAPATGVTIPVLNNDTPALGEAFLPDTLCLVDGDNCVKIVVKPGQGTWQVNPDGTITFTPAPGFSGDATIEYQVTDTAGNVYTSPLTVTVEATVKPPSLSLPDAGGAPPSLSLPDTGGAPLYLVGWGLAMVLLGFALVWRTRRRVS